MSLNPFKDLDKLVKEVTEFTSWKLSDDEAKYYVHELIEGEVYQSIVREKWLEVIAEKRFKATFYNMFISFENASKEIGFDYSLELFRENNDYEITIYDGNKSIIIRGKINDVFLKATCIAWIYFNRFEV
jgi:DNA-binding transcriptional regulator WhiA